MAEDQESGKLHIDADWKAQAQAEKQKLAEQAKKTEATGTGETAGAAGRMPPASFETLLSTMATQALFAMGAIADPRTGQRTVHLDLARHHIDMLSVIEEKTKGNLTEEESNTLAGTLYELRTRYVQAANASQGAG